MDLIAIPMAARKSAKKSAKRTTAKRAKSTRKSAKKSAKKLTKKQLAQRKYAASMKGIRKRAKKASGGKGRIAKRAPATKLRRKLGLKRGKAAKKR